MPIDYSKWKKIDVSDDEDDTFKHIDAQSLFRWRHQSRLEKMAAAKKERDELKRKKEGLQQTLDHVQKIIDDPETDSAEREKWAVQIEELRKLEKEYEEKEKEMQKKEQKQAWNVDTIGRTGFSKTRVNPTPSRPLPEPMVIDSLDGKTKLAQFYRINRDLIHKFCMLNTLEETEQFLMDNTHLCSEETATLIAAECCDVEYQNHGALMEKMAHQATVLNYLLELAARLKWPPGNPKMISAALGRLKKAREQKMDDGFKADARAYADLVIEQMKVKKEEKMKKDKEVEEEKRKKRLGPGGLDPMVVLETLPKEMRRCFVEKDLESLKRVCNEMPEEEFNKHFQQCIDSGLWVPDANKRMEKDGQSMDETATDDDQTCQDADEMDDAKQGG